MKVIIGLIVSSLFLVGLFQNCAKNQAVRFDSANTKALGDPVNPPPPTDPLVPVLPPGQTFKNCQLSDGTVVPHLHVMWTQSYTTVGDKNICDKFELRQCFDGTLNPSSIGTNTTTSACQAAVIPQNPAGQASCTIDGQTIKHGAAVMAFAATHVTGANNCIAQTRVCVNGTFTGSEEYSHLTCSDGLYQPANNQPIDCEFNGLKIPDGSFAITDGNLDPSSGCSYYGNRCTAGVLAYPTTQISCVPIIKN